MKTTLSLTLLALAATLLDGSLLELQRGGDAWRVLTCHFTHFSYEQLAWDALTFLFLGAVCERQNRRAFHATLLASAILVPIAVLVCDPRIASYRGLSGIDSALFALLLATAARRSRAALLLAVGFAAKIGFELATGATLFVTDMGPGVEAVPIAHVAGALVGLVVALLYEHERSGSNLANPVPRAPEALQKVAGGQPRSGAATGYDHPPIPTPEGSQVSGMRGDERGAPTRSRRTGPMAFT